MERKKLNDTRSSITHKLSLPEFPNCYFIIGLYEDGRPGELFIRISHDELGGAYEAFSIAVSMLFQSGWSVEDLAKKFAHMRFKPDGMTGNKSVPIAKSIPDYLFRWLQSDEFKQAAKKEIDNEQKKET